MNTCRAAKVCCSDRDFDTKLAMIAYADIRCMTVFRKEYSHLPRMHVQQTGGCVAVESHILGLVVWHQSMLKTCDCSPAHHLNALERYLDVDKPSMRFKAGFLAR